jgi:hypothetical protein
MKVAGAETMDTNDLEGHEGSWVHRAAAASLFGPNTRAPQVTEMMWRNGHNWA